MKKKNLKMDSAEFLIAFVESCEDNNSKAISELVKENVDSFFEINKIISELKKVSSEKTDDFNDTRELVLELHQELLSIEKLYYFHKCILGEIFENSKTVLQAINQNIDLFKGVDINE